MQQHKTLVILKENIVLFRVLRLADAFLLISQVLKLSLKLDWLKKLKLKIKT